MITVEAEWRELDMIVCLVRGHAVPGALGGLIRWSARVERRQLWSSELL